MKDFHVNGLLASHHNVIVFVEFDMACWFGEGIAEVVVNGDVRIVDLFFFCPLKDDKVFHIHVLCASCWLSCVGELSCAFVVGEYFCR